MSGLGAKRKRAVAAAAAGNPSNLFNDVRSMLDTILFQNNPMQLSNRWETWKSLWHWQHYHFYSDMLSRLWSMVCSTVTSSSRKTSTPKKPSAFKPFSYERLWEISTFPIWSMRTRNAVDKGRCRLVKSPTLFFDRVSFRQPVDFRVLLDERRKALPEIDASIEKCMMITRLITFLDQVIAEWMILFQ